MIINYKTIISLGPKNINYLVGKYDKLLEIPLKEAVKKAH
jgi:hypothetical protein